MRSMLRAVLSINLPLVLFLALVAITAAVAEKPERSRSEVTLSAAPLTGRAHASTAELGVLDDCADPEGAAALVTDALERFDLVTFELACSTGPEPFACDTSLVDCAAAIERACRALGSTAKKAEIKTVGLTG